MRKEWENKKHLLLLGIATMFLAFGAFPATVEAQGKTEVYVSTTKSLLTVLVTAQKLIPIICLMMQ